MKKISTLWPMGLCLVSLVVSMIFLPAISLAWPQSYAHVRHLAFPPNIQPGVTAVKFRHFNKHRSHHHWRIGRHIRVLPRGFFRIRVGRLHYYVHAGVYYRVASKGFVVVKAPYGAFVKVLPVGYRVVRFGAKTYYHYNDIYYVSYPVQDGYVVVEEPTQTEMVVDTQPIGEPSRPFVYPNKGQNSGQQATDEFECHRWGTKETGFDPSLLGPPAHPNMANDYERAKAACLEARGYTVK